MDLEVVDVNGRSMGTRKAPMPPRQGETVLLPAPYPDDRHTTAALNVAEYSEPRPYLVRHVIWDMLGQKVTLVVEEAEFPAEIT